RRTELLCVRIAGVAVLRGLLPEGVSGVAVRRGLGRVGHRVSSQDEAGERAPGAGAPGELRGEACSVEYCRSSTTPEFPDTCTGAKVTSAACALSGVPVSRSSPGR